MVSFQNADKRIYDVYVNDEYLTRLNLIASSISNKFDVITNFVEKVSGVLGSRFDNWFYNFITKYENNEDKRFDILQENISTIRSFIVDYLDNQQIDFTQFVDESKTKKNSIKFDSTEIKEIIKLSNYLKIYSVISCSSNLKLDKRLHTKIYNEFCEEIFQTEVVKKIFGVIKTKTFRYNITDRYMWDYIKMVQCKSINTHVLEIFNFVMNQILVLCDETRNPITYFVGTIDESVKWFLRSVYKGSIVYNDTISTEDVHSTSLNNLKTYSYNDTLGRLKGIAYEQIYDKLERDEVSKFGNYDKTDDLITTFQDRVLSIEYISPLCYSVVYPILSRATSIPYNHFKTLTPEHASVLSVFVRNIMKQVFQGKYRNLLKLLGYYPTRRPSVEITYNVKNVAYFINLQRSVGNFFFGFKSGEAVPNDLIRYFVGKVSRVRFVNTITGEDLSGVPLSKLEEEMVHFLTYFFSGNLENEIDQISNVITSYF